MADKICSQAYWHKTKCNWVGRSENFYESEDKSLPSISCEALGPNFYDGSSGIAFFLAKLFSITKKEEYGVTAKGAISHSLSQIEKIPKDQSLGFYYGKIGIIFSAVNVGQILKNKKIVEDAHKSLEEIINNKSKTQHLMDVISGNAGAIAPLIYLYKIFKEEKILNLAKKLGQEIIVKASKTETGWSWGIESNGIENKFHNLTGFSHGAAGMGYGLLELFLETKNNQFLEGAQQAFNYEDNWFDPELLNWPDFRIFDEYSNTERNEENNNFEQAMAWCHGAPGIGLSRLRAFQALQEKDNFKDAEFALESVKYFLKENSDKFYDFSLCHGISGISEILIYGSEILKKHSYYKIAEKIALSGNKQYSQYTWPCGVNEGETPGLMLGLAGIGYFFLRLYDPKAIPSVLIIASK
ncbi:MAG: hypothetical protein OEQ12_04845 [Nitrosopumilus sp.]|nr:hypothetical protein [Nitrosopumilus sp.]